MKKIIAFIATICLLTNFAHAQTTSSMADSSSMRHYSHQHRSMNDSSMARHHMGHKDDHGKMNGHHAQLDLTADQRAQMKTIRENYEQQKEQLFNNDKLTLGDYKKQLLALEKNKKDKEKALLTTDQQKKIDDWKKTESDKRASRQDAMLQRMKTTAGLADDQVTKIKAMQTKLHDKVKSIAQNDNLLQEQKHEQIKALMEEQKTKIASILTPEQQDKLKTMMHNREAR